LQNNCEKYLHKNLLKNYRN